MTMAEPLTLFQNFTLTQSRADQARNITFTQDWIGFLIDVASVSTDGKVVFVVQWSNDGNAPWFDSTPVCTATAPGTFVKSMPVQACYWRLAAKVTGTDPVAITCSARAVA